MSQQKPSYSEFKLVSSTKAYPHHILKFHTPKPVDISKFTPPVRLQRRTLPTEEELLAQQAQAASEASTSSSAGGINKALVAPSGSWSKTNLFKKKVRQIETQDEEDRLKKKAESVPWILEDDEGDNLYMGNLEGGQSSNYVLFMFSEDGFKVVPADNWYKFNPKLKYKTLTSDEADASFSKQNEKVDRWMMRKLKGIKDEEINDAKPSKGKFKIADNIGFDQDEDSVVKQKIKTSGDLDELDFDIGEEFQDDEEDVFEHGEEEKKEEPKTKDYERLRASDEEAEDEDEDKLDSTGHETRKLIHKYDKNEAYASDEDSDPYADSDDKEDLEEEVKDSPSQQSQEFQKRPNSVGSPGKSNGAAKPKLDVSKKKSNVKAKKDLSSGPSSPAASTVTKKRPAPSESELLQDKDAVKKAKLKPSSPPSSSSTAASPTVSSTSSDEHLITEAEIIAIIKANPNIQTKDLIGKVKKKLKKDSRNKSLLSTIVKKVAISNKVNGGLELKPEYI